MNLKKQLSCVYLYTFFSTFKITDAVWVALLAARGLYAACALLCGAGALLAGAAPAWGCLAGPMLVQGAIAVWFLHAMQRLNDSISSDRRATLISVDSMAYSLLMIPASPFLG